MTCETRTDWANELENGYDAFDVVDAVAEDDDGDSFATAPTQVEPQPAEAPAAATPQKSDDERLAELFASMPTRRKVLLNILRLCMERQDAAEVGAKVDELQAQNHSVFSGATLVALLERNGGLKHVNEDGTDYVEPADKTPAETAEQEEPGALVEDAPAGQGDEDDFEVEFLEVEQPQASYWVTTEAGRAAVAADDPRARLLELLEADALYRPVYREILETMVDGPLTKPQIDVIVKASPLTQEPRRLGGYFVDRLEKVDAIEWQGAWTITSLGREALELDEMYE